MARRTQRGFTLIEALVVVAIFGIVAALGLGAIQSGRERGAAENAGSDLLSELYAAKARAIERGVPVWVIVYPNVDRDGAAGGAGAYFVYEDVGLAFGTSGAGAVGVRRYETFSPPDDIEADPADLGRLTERVYLDDYPGRNVSFGLQPGQVYAAPFAGLEASFTGSPACNFCSGTPPRGAIVFTPEGTIRFVDGAGDRVLQGGARLARTGGLRLRGRTTEQSYLYSLSAPTAFIGFSK